MNRRRGERRVIGVKVNFKTKGDAAHRELLKRVKGLKKAYVTIGVHEGAGGYASGESVVNVALWNEFGTENIPSRPFIRAAIYGNEGLINQWRVELLGKVVDGKMDVKTALEALGFRLRELIRRQIRSNMPPPNASAVTARKRAKGLPAQTLMETQLLLRSIEYKVNAA